MKIGIVTTWFERGAAYVSKQYREVLIKEHEVFIYVRGGEKYAMDDPNWNVENLYWGKRLKYFAGTNINLEDFEQWIKKNSIELVFFNEQHNWKPIIHCNKLGIKVGAYIDYYKKDTLKLFNCYDFVICNTRRHFQAFQEHRQCYYVPWGTQLDKFKPKEKPLQYRDKLIFLHSAGMNPKRKGTDLLIKAIENITDDSFKLIVHTQTDLLDFFPDLKSSMKKLVDLDRLIIIQKTISAPGIYFYGDVYVYPTRLEGIGLTILEASGSGLPVITTNQAPMNEFVREGVNGKLIRVEKEVLREDNYYWPQSIIDISSLQECIEWYILNQSSIPEMKKESRKYAEEILDWGKNAKELNNIFKNISLIDSSFKQPFLEDCFNFEKQRGFRDYLKTFLPYVYLKRKIKRIFK